MEEFSLEADRNGFIGYQAYPVFEAAKSSGSFGIIPVEQLLHDADFHARAPGSGYARGSYKFEPASYTTLEYGWEEPVDEDEAEMYAEYFDAEMVATQRARDVVLRNAEKRIAAAVFNATTFAAYTTGVTNEWDTNHTTNAVPIDDVEAACQAVWSQCGLWPNAIIMNRHVFRNLRNLDQILERISASGAGDKIRAEDVTAQQLSAVFDLPHVLVAGGAKSTAKEGQTIAFDDIWSSEYAMVCRIAESNDIREPCIGRTFHWSATGSEIGGHIESYEEAQTRSTIIRCRHRVGEKGLYVQAGHLLSNVTTI
jgi:hypothetical protein